MTAISTTTLNLLDDLVRIDSVNPGLDPAGAGEAQIAAYIARWGRSAGLGVEVLEGTTGWPSVLLRGGRDHGGRLAHRGFVWTELTVTGVAAHGSRPHLGADAILAAGHHLVAFCS